MSKEMISLIQKKAVMTLPQDIDNSIKMEYFELDSDESDKKPYITPKCKMMINLTAKYIPVTFERKLFPE